jgi:hypothetical protein
MKGIRTAMVSLAALFTVACSGDQAGRTDNANMETNTLNQDTIFPRGAKAPPDTFTGTVYVQPLAAKNENNNFSVASVTFEAGARVLF